MLQCNELVRNLITAHCKQANEFTCGLSLQCRHTHAHQCAWWIMMNPWSPSIFLSQSMGFDICSKHKREDKQASVIFNKRSSVKGSKQNLSSVMLPIKQTNSKVELLRESNEKKQPLSIKKKHQPKQNKAKKKNNNHPTTSWQSDFGEEKRGK